MKTKIKHAGLTIMGIFLLAFPGYVYSELNTAANTETDYYGADLTQFPPKVREWITERAFTKEKMEKPHMIDSKLKVWWSDDENAVLAEASYTIAKGYVGADTRKTWGEKARYSGSANLGALYGEHAKYHTLKFQWQLKQKTEQLLQRDPVYAEIIEFSKQLCDEIEYDWANFSGYRGPVKRTPGKKYFVCDGYANEVMERILELSCVQAVQKWSSSGHAWNVLKLVDGRTLYYDLTWFDNEHIDEKTGEIYQKDDYDWANITFDKELFTYSNIGYGSRVFHHAQGKPVSEISREE
ncbi:MAG: hypothetical protein LUG18_09070 [Candidatus Azobacteroides sp.]|nr:hypothetical protein [Candidatus Azobacteroides sp.]